MNIVIAGFGPHCTRVYLPFLNKLSDEFNIKIKLIIDLENKKSEVEDELSKSFLQPENIFYIKNDPGKLYELDSQLENVLGDIASTSKIDAMIITTEPRFHKMYLDWAVQHGIRVLVEKPLVAFESINTDDQAASEIYSYTKSLCSALEDGQSNVSVQCQRRYNEAYDFAFNYLKTFIGKYKMPISYINIYQCDGMWNDPEEYLKRESHPFKYGYGKLLHSGYHFVDLACYFFSLNESIESWKYDSLSVYSQVFRPIDAVDQIARSHFESSKFNIESEADLAGIGELDSYNLIQATRNGIVVTTIDITSMQNSVSKRTDFNALENDKEKMGVFKQEEFRIMVGPLLMLKISLVYQDEDRFYRVEITNNPNLDNNVKVLVKDFKWVDLNMGGKTTRLSLNQGARFNLLRNFLENTEEKSRISSHLLTNQLLSIIYRNICKLNRGEAPYEKIRI